MADITNEQLKDLIVGKFAELDKRIDHLDKKMELGLAEMNKKMEVGFAELRGEIAKVHAELKGEIQAVRNELKGDIKTIEAKLDGFDKRISNQEFITRSILATVLGGILLALGRFLLPLDVKKLLTSFADFLKTMRV
ncbi:MAG: hypothetical protein RMK91_12585 [Pseudanabaenaceae cyanobacterium SKYGB_i_bin29]|nr:DUF1664 domain-containing protein [Pseudanabaenaceae cyanobacterium SKYG29]MDW8422690.1 hypothetical protein [Pseudanabaenaceae cyanobacterium SKYGB_i_bin29]